MAIIYRDRYPHTGKDYIGSSVSEDPEYGGSMSHRGMARIKADHDRIGKPVVRGEREILWRGPADNTLLRREYAFITEYGTNRPEIGYNLMPMLLGVNIGRKFHWKHDHTTHVCHTTDCPYGRYEKLQARCLADGRCSYRSGDHNCGEHWGDQERGVYWLKFSDLDGNTEIVYQGTSRSLVYNKYYIEHKDMMMRLLGLDIDDGKTA